jgi:hypothetical protein
MPISRRRPKQESGNLVNTAFFMHRTPWSHKITKTTEAKDRKTKRQRQSPLSRNRETTTNRHDSLLCRCRSCSIGVRLLPAGGDHGPKWYNGRTPPRQQDQTTEMSRQPTIPAQCPARLSRLVRPTHSFVQGGGRSGLWLSGRPGLGGWWY